MKLVYENTGKLVQVGDKVTSKNRGEELEVVAFSPPHKPSSEGKVDVKTKDGFGSTYYVGVIGAEWIEREDRREGPAVPEDKLTFDVEHTDTFGGDANYSWVNRKVVTMDKGKCNDHMLIRACKEALGLKGVRHRKEDMGDTIRLNLVGMCQVVFITPRY